MKKSILFILAGVILVVVFAFGSTYYKGQQASKAESVAQGNAPVFNREYSQTFGSDEAKVIITEFFDPACGTCGAFHPFLKKILDGNPGRIKIVMRYAPLHKGSDTLVKILEASKKQGKFLEILEAMYDSQPQWASHSGPQPEKIWEFLPKAGLDINKLKNDMNLPEVSRNVAQDVADLRALNVTKTPGFFVNGRPLVNFGYEQLLELIRSEYVKNYPN